MEHTLGVVTGVDDNEVYYMFEGDDTEYVVKNEVYEVNIIGEELFDFEIGDSLLIFHNRYFHTISLPLPLNDADRFIKDKK
ncbi:hypothetical protein WAF17_11965 [Bernardetia sp. ABR2-2B]|uniref:hypothetical protein n=1 Tax=Bernardetia sp. ABR2-2B TaxID=3127472 RepID=UPI0030CB3580